LTVSAMANNGALTITDNGTFDYVIFEGS